MYLHPGEKIKIVLILLGEYQQDLSCLNYVISKRTYSPLLLATAAPNDGERSKPKQ